MRVLAIHKSNFTIREFINVTNISTVAGSTVIDGTEITQGETAGSFILSNTAYLVRIIEN